MLFLGVIGEYVGRIYYETKRRPHFLVKEGNVSADLPVTIALGPERATNSFAAGQPPIREVSRPAEASARLRGTG